MKHERKIYGVISVLTLVLLLVVGSMVYRTLFQEPNNPNPNPNPEPKAEIQVTLDNYTVYKLDDVSFPFIIARIELSSDELIVAALSDFYTSEQLNLNQTLSQQEELSDLGYSLDEQRVDFELPKESNLYAVNVFIPIRNKDAQSVTLYFAKNTKTALTFDLSFANGTKEMLGYKPDEHVFTDDATYRIEVVSFADVTGYTVMNTLANGEVVEASFPSTARIFAVRLMIEPLSSQMIQIESARYTLLNDNQTSYAFEKNMQVEEYVNLMQEEITGFTSGYVFFDLYANDIVLFDQNSKFELKLLHLDQWITLTLND